MIQNFNFINLNDLLKKDNANKIIILGLIIIIASIISFFNKGFGIKLISYAFGMLLMYISYLTLININELKRYESRDKIMPYNISLLVTFILSLSLFLFPNKIQSFISSLVGAYIVYTQLVLLLKSKNNPYYNFSTFGVFKLIFGLIFIISPLFLSSLISSLISMIGLLIGGYILLLGKNIR